MTAPVRTLALELDRPTRRGWLGLSLSILCFVHCLGAVALLPLLPAAFSFLTENEIIEWALIAVSAAFAARLIWSERRWLGRWRGPLFGAYTVVTVGGAAGLLVESEALLQASLASLALLQLVVLAGRNSLASVADDRVGRPGGRRLSSTNGS